MNRKRLLLTTFSTAVLVTPLLVTAWHSENIKAAQAQIQQQTQTATISLAFRDLRQPHWLSVSSLSPGTKLQGRIELNGKLIQQLNSHSTKIDISSHLSKGENILKISGEYAPANTSVEVQFIGPHTQVSQRTSGDGHLQQTLIVEVQ